MEHRERKMTKGRDRRAKNRGQWAPIPACPVGPADRTGVVKIFVFLDLKEKS